MKIPFCGGEFISSIGELNYQAVLDDFPNAKIIRIVTYNISNNAKKDALLDALQESNAEIQIISNIPSRHESYYKCPAGENMRKSAQKNIQFFINKLNPQHFPIGFSSFVNKDNHAKLIGTENVVYIGSANFSNESALNVEAGVIIRDKAFIKTLYSTFFDQLRDNSLSYYDEGFCAFQLYILSLSTKFQHHYTYVLQNMYYESDAYYSLSNPIFISESFLDSLYNDLCELESLLTCADDTYDEQNDQYNIEIDEITSTLSDINIKWLKAEITEDGALYNLAVCDPDEYASEILNDQFSAEAYDDNLNYYAERSMELAQEYYDDLYYCFEGDADNFLMELENIISFLDKLTEFTAKWKPLKINPNIDNT